MLDKIKNGRKPRETTRNKNRHYCAVFSNIYFYFCIIIKHTKTMNKTMPLVTLIASIAIFLACSNADDISNKLSHIDKVGDTNPTLAMSMLDSMSTGINNQRENVVMEYRLVEISLQQRLRLKPATTIKAEELARYFNMHGTQRNKARANYLAGVACMDLGDARKAIKYLSASESTYFNYDARDGLWISDTYSRLRQCYALTHDYENALRSWLSEYTTSDKSKKIAPDIKERLEKAYKALSEDSASVAGRNNVVDKPTNASAITTTDVQNNDTPSAGKKNHYLLLATILTSIIAVLTITIFFFFNRWSNFKSLRTIAAKDDKISSMQEEYEMLHDQIADREEALERAKKQLDETEEHLKQVNDKIAEYDAKMQENECLLTDKMSQNKILMRLLQQAELETRDNDIMPIIKKAAEGHHNMTDAEWKQFYSHIDAIYPTFADRLLREMGTFSDKQRMVCYLMLAGVVRNDIQNITGLSRVTVWRWTSRFAWIAQFQREMSASGTNGKGTQPTLC